MKRAGLDTKFTIEIRVRNRGGLHVRPISYIAKMVKKSSSKVTLMYKERSVDAQSIMQLMLLKIPKGALVHFVIEGVDAKQVVYELIQAFENRFGEEL